ncbi:electron transporter RnfD [Pedobacter psychrodurus]|uniref:Electron transporter RnfD n=1 Tax=Pedobacter psychrodurus TaxID=2530456 RepID=A0A4R0Q6I8_9SPHI|nr:electron transporter RnfD [Pedobacter psychrodurus]TCD28365.1 electron transporter RnfD [Pedobacter psychrodurus]
MKFKKNWLVSSTTNRYLLLVVLVFIVICFGFKNFDTRSHGYSRIEVELKDDNINAGSKHILYTGRVSYNDTVATFVNAGTSIELNFIGSKISAELKSSSLDSCFLIIIDNDFKKARKILTTPTKATHVLATGLKKGRHHLRLIKIMPNWVKGYFYKFNITSGKAQKAPKPLYRKMEFYGDSQTEGSMVEAPIGPDPTNSGNTFYNSELTYAALTAKVFKAQYSNISYSGVGLVAGYTNFTMNKVFDLYDPRNPGLKWDFANYTPNVVVVNLFQNDQGIAGNPTSKQYDTHFTIIGLKPSDSLFINRYKLFINALHEKYPNSHIICALGSMDASAKPKWKGYLTTAVNELKIEKGIKKIYPLFFPYKATPGHPKKIEHQVMADTLVSFIRQNGIWK